MESAKPLQDAYKQAEELIARGDLAQAADVCKDMLHSNPDYPYGYHLMATLFSATGTFDRALTFAQLATELGPEISAFHLQKGRVLYSLGDFSGASETFMAAHALEPENPVIMLLLANCHTRRGEFSQASKLFERARAISDIPEIDEQEGLCQLLRGNHTNAERLFDRLIERCPDYAWGHIHKGKLLMDNLQYAQAEACITRAIKYAPGLYEPHYLMALLNEWQGHAAIAIRYATDAIPLKPMAWESHVYLGALLTKERHYDEAEQLLKQALNLRPASAYTLQLLADCMHQQKKSVQWHDFIHTHLADDKHKTLRAFLLALSKDTQPILAPQSYITSYYDGFAEQYDYYQRHVSAYSAPSSCAEALARCKELAPSPRRLLDIGCGTGLSGEALRDMAQDRCGVDLSTRMLEIARRKQIYHNLHLQEGISFMLGCKQRFEIVAAIDSLSAMGGLSGFIQAARNALTQNGLLVFTIEKDLHAKKYHLAPNGRYAHHPDYVTEILTSRGYSILHHQDYNLRMDFNHIIPGQIFIARKVISH